MLKRDLNSHQEEKYMPGMETKSFLSTLEPLALRKGDPFELGGRPALEQHERQSVPSS